MEITEEPVDRGYGIDFGLRDPFGNHLRIAQMQAGLSAARVAAPDAGVATPARVRPRGPVELPTARTHQTGSARGCGAAGSAPHWQCGGQGFESPQLHPSDQAVLRFGRAAFVVGGASCGSHWIHPVPPQSRRVRGRARRCGAVRRGARNSQEPRLSRHRRCAGGGRAPASTTAPMAPDSWAWITAPRHGSCAGQPSGVQACGRPSPSTMVRTLIPALRAARRISTRTSSASPSSLPCHTPRSARAWRTRSMSVTRSWCPGDLGANRVSGQSHSALPMRSAASRPRAGMTWL